jgi:hypothetical protein
VIFLWGVWLLNSTFTSCCDESFVHHPENTEHASTYCLVSEGLDLVQIPIMLILGVVFLITSGDVMTFLCYLVISFDTP